MRQRQGHGAPGKKNDMAGMQFDIENQREGKLQKYQADPRGEQGQEIRQERGSLLSEIISQEKEKGMHAGQLLVREGELTKVQQTAFLYTAVVNAFYNQVFFLCDRHELR